MKQLKMQPWKWAKMRSGNIWPFMKNEWKIGKIEIAY